MFPKPWEGKTKIKQFEEKWYQWHCQYYVKDISSFLGGGFVDIGGYHQYHKKAIKFGFWQESKMRKKNGICFKQIWVFAMPPRPYCRKMKIFFREIGIVGVPPI